MKTLYVRFTISTPYGMITTAGWSDMPRPTTDVQFDALKRVFLGIVKQTVPNADEIFVDSITELDKEVTP